MTLAITSFILLAACGGGAQSPTEERGDNRPNILLIVADDLGYSDIAPFGGEIGTPNLSELAERGIQLTHFHVATNCAPTRAMLMTGMDNHRVGMGTHAEVLQLRYPELQKFPGYDGYLNFRAKALPEVMRDAGYRTYMTGKWHLGVEAETSPHARGFQQTFVLLEGAGGHFDDRQVVPGLGRDTVRYRENGELVSTPEDFYSTRTFSEKMIGFLEKDSVSEQPFFAYLAFTAPHWPVQAPKSAIERYRGNYDEGYDLLFEQRLARQKELGLVDADVQGSPLHSRQKPWSEMTKEERRVSSRKMEVYAAMVGDMDYYIGEVLNTLEQTGELENTVVIFMSDNGAEGNTSDRAPAWRAFVDEHFDNDFDNLGAEDSYIFYGPGWARASASPSKYYKSNTTQGGILSPAIVSYPEAEAASRYDGFLSVMDIMPTILELAGVNYEPDEDLPLMGRSFASLLANESSDEGVHSENHEMGWEMVNHRAYRLGDWKLVMTQPPWGQGQWQLYDLADDPSESHDLSNAEPERFADMIERWRAYAEANQVVVFEDGQVPSAGKRR